MYIVQYFAFRMLSGLTHILLFSVLAAAGYRLPLVGCRHSHTATVECCSSCSVDSESVATRTAAEASAQQYCVNLCYVQRGMHMML